MSPETPQSGLLREFAPCCPPALRGFCRIVTASANNGPVLSFRHSADDCWNQVVILLACPELLSAHEQFLCRLQGIGIQWDRTHPALRLALLQMNFPGHEVYPP